MDLLQIRDQLDEIDKEMVRLFEERMKLVGEVAEFKFKTGKQVFYILTIHKNTPCVIFFVDDCYV